MNIKSRVISFVAVGLALCSVSGPHRAAGQSGAPTPTPEDRLYRAALNRQTAEVRALLKSGVDPNALNSFKTPPLLGALLLPSDTVETVRVLLEGGARTDVRDAQGRTPLILAAARGSLDVLRALLQARADVNARSQSGETALLAALQREAAEAALLLVQHGADPNLRGEQQPAALSLALQLWDTPRGVQHADRATVEAHVKNADALIAALLQARADVNAPAPSGRTPLMDAISRDRVFQPGGWRSWVRPLLDRGADPNAHLPKQEPPLFHTIDADRENLELPRLLIERGADVNGVENRSVLVEALRGHDFALAGLLLEKGAKIGVLDEARKTPLHWAAFHGQGELVRELLARGGDPNALDMLGQTPLALARKASHAEVAALLVRSGGRVAAP
ncbi:MAG TPA: ankyrin repeat domain-containing protein, partial [Armatimonadota bacterium]|nr:ankyrin repeat domain-containing protein [Armatimonadota bacterium]